MTSDHADRTSTSCVTRCSERPSCNKAVYDNAARICRIKGTGSMEWVASSNTDSIRLGTGDGGGGPVVNPPQPPREGSEVNRCSERSYSATNGKRYGICSGHGFVAARDFYFAPGIPTAEICAEICSYTPGCSKAVWQRAGGVCHVLSLPLTGGRTTWVVAQAYDAIREV